MLNHQNGLHHQLCFKVFSSGSAQFSRFKRIFNHLVVWLVDLWKQYSNQSFNIQKQWHSVAQSGIKWLKPTRISGWNESPKKSPPRDPRKNNELLLVVVIRSCGPFCGGLRGKSATSVWSHVGQSHSLQRPRILTPPLGLDPLGDAEGETEAVPSSSSSSYASKKHTETGFAIITWNNPKNWRNPVSPRDKRYLSFEIKGWFSHVTRSLWWTPWKYRKIRISWCRNQSWMMRLKWLLWTCYFILKNDEISFKKCYSPGNPSHIPPMEKEKHLPSNL